MLVLHKPHVMVAEPATPADSFGTGGRDTNETASAKKEQLPLTLSQSLIIVLAILPSIIPKYKIFNSVYSRTQNVCVIFSTDTFTPKVCD